MKMCGFAMIVLSFLLILVPRLHCCPTTKAPVPQTTTTVPGTTLRTPVTQPSTLNTTSVKPFMVKTTATTEINNEGTTSMDDFGTAADELPLSTPMALTTRTGSERDASTPAVNETTVANGEKQDCPQIQCELDTNDPRYKHLKDREAFKLIGYIPTATSGVTIATGVDLGQQSKSRLESLGVPKILIDRFEPYLGIKTKAAVEAKGLKPEKLILTEEEAIHLDCLFMNEVTNVVTPYAEKMTQKGLACLISLRHWAGALGNTKYNPKGPKLVVYTDDTKTTTKNYVWDAITNKTGTDATLLKALQDTLLRHKEGTAAYNRIQHEIDYMNG